MNDAYIQGYALIGPQQQWVRRTGERCVLFASWWGMKGLTLHALCGEGLRWESRPQGPFWLSQPQCPPVLGREEGVGRGGH